MAHILIRCAILRQVYLEAALEEAEKQYEQDTEESLRKHSGSGKEVPGEGKHFSIMQRASF